MLNEEIPYVLLKTFSIVIDINIKDIELVMNDIRD